MKKLFLPALLVAFFALSFQSSGNATTLSSTQTTLAQDVPSYWVKVSSWEVNGVHYTKWWTGTNFIIVDDRDVD
jgi:hypothetical protein